MHLQIHIIVYSTIVTFEWCLVIYFKTIMYCEENYPIIPIIIIKTRGVTISTLKLGNQFFFSSYACSNVLLINIESLSSTHKSTAHTYFIYFKSFIVYCKSDVVYDEKGKFDHFVSCFHFTLLSTIFISMKKRLTNHFMQVNSSRTYKLFAEN